MRFKKVYCSSQWEDVLLGGREQEPEAACHMVSTVTESHRVHSREAERDDCWVGLRSLFYPVWDHRP